MILNKKNNKKYVGSSVNVDSRLTQHLWLLRNKKHDNVYLQNSFIKFGENNFIFKKIELCDIENLVERENFYIKKYKSLCNQNGYNICMVSETRRNVLSDDTKTKLSISNMKKNNNFSLFNCTHKTTGHVITFNSLVDAANYLIINGFSNGSPKNIRQKISYTLRNKKINNGHSGSIRKTAYNHYWNIIN
jgi:group I intron endonuclease